MSISSTIRSPFFLPFFCAFSKKGVCANLMQHLSSVFFCYLMVQKELDVMK